MRQQQRTWSCAFTVALAVLLAACGGHSKMTSEDHSTTAGIPSLADEPGIDHGAASSPVAVVTAAPRSSAEMARVDPDATLRPDAFDAPAPIAVAEAAKALGGGGHGGHSMAPSSSATAEATGSKAVIYTCPMHPEVTSATPGKCPKCGMTLVEKEKR